MLSRRRYHTRGTLVLLLAALVLAGCGSSDEVENPALVPVELDKSNPERLLRYYFGGYVRPAAQDPFEAGLLVDREGRYYVHLDSLAAHVPGAAASLTDRNNDGVFDWEEMEAFIDATYYEARRLPETLTALRDEVPYGDEKSEWMSVEVDGVMTTARRRIFVSRSALRQALQHYNARGEKVIYPVGTSIVGEHYDGSRRLETTVMRKRPDGFWDFFVYDAEGALSATTNTPPRALKSPVQCVGCHFGSKLFEPEKSFPAQAAAGPHGPRQMYVDPELRDGELVTFFEEHRRRSDTILGLYATLFVAQLRAEQRAGSIAPEDAALLKELGL